jgi:hypothetical protein
MTTDVETKLIEAILKAIAWLGAEEISREEIRELLKKELERAP